RRRRRFFRQEDLRQRDRRQVISIVAVDDFDLMPVAHQLRDSIESDVAAGASVVELAICILLDKVSFGGCRHSPAHSNAVRLGLRAASSWWYCMAKRKRT